MRAPEAARAAARRARRCLALPRPRNVQRRARRDHALPLPLAAHAGRRGVGRPPPLLQGAAWRGVSRAVASAWFVRYRIRFRSRFTCAHVAQRARCQRCYSGPFFVRFIFFLFFASCRSSAVMAGGGVGVLETERNESCALPLLRRATAASATRFLLFADSLVRARLRELGAARADDHQDHARRTPLPLHHDHPLPRLRDGLLGRDPGVQPARVAAVDDQHGCLRLLGGFVRILIGVSFASSSVCVLLSHIRQDSELGGGSFASSSACVVVTHTRQDHQVSKQRRVTVLLLPCSSRTGVDVLYTRRRTSARQIASKQDNHPQRPYLPIEDASHVGNAFLFETLMLIVALILVRVWGRHARTARFPIGRPVATTALASSSLPAVSHPGVCIRDCLLIGRRVAAVVVAASQACSSPPSRAIGAMEVA